MLKCECNSEDFTPPTFSKSNPTTKTLFLLQFDFKNWPQTLSMRPLAFRALALWQKHVALCDLYREHYTTVYKAMLYLIWRPSHISNISSHLNRVWPNECIAVLCFAVIAPQHPPPQPCNAICPPANSVLKAGNTLLAICFAPLCIVRS